MRGRRRQAADKMAELQDFMLVAEKDRDEAMRIASVVASSEFSV